MRKFNCCTSKLCVHVSFHFSVDFSAYPVPYPFYRDSKVRKRPRRWVVYKSLVLQDEFPRNVSKSLQPKTLDQKFPLKCKR